MELKKSYLESHPDEDGYFGKYGGAYIPSQLEKQFKGIDFVVKDYLIPKKI